MIKLLDLIRSDLERERRGKAGVENLAVALKRTPTFASEDSQQNVQDKLHHVSHIHFKMLFYNIAIDVYCLIFKCHSKFDCFR